MLLYEDDDEAPCRKGGADTAEKWLVSRKKSRLDSRRKSRLAVSQGGMAVSVSNNGGDDEAEVEVKAEAEMEMEVMDLTDVEVEMEVEVMDLTDTPPVTVDSDAIASVEVRRCKLTSA